MYMTGTKAGVYLMYRKMAYTSWGSALSSGTEKEEDATTLLK